MKTNKDIEKEFFKQLIAKTLETNPNPKQLNAIKTSLAKEFGLKKIIKNTEILAYSNKKDRNKLSSILNIKPIRELSGVTVLALFAKPHPCPHGKCIYCPGGVNSEFGDTPQSYTGCEPAARRAIRNKYDPYLQVFNRLEHYVINGHIPDKIELIFMGGTFPSLDVEYRNEFVNFVYKAINDFGDEFFYYDRNNKNISQQKHINYDKFNEFFETKTDLNCKEREKRITQKMLELKTKNLKTYEYEITRNETGIIRSIGLTIESKPDWALKEHCDEMLKYGCTRFEIGVQTLDDNLLKKINRGHTIEDTRKSFQIMKDMCFKINAHMMLNLPYSNLKIDRKSLIDLFENPDFRPDMLKIYPCLVIAGTPLFDMYKKQLFIPLDTIKTAKLIASVFKYFPRYVRVMRIQRDVPTPQIIGGVKNSNLRQFVEVEMNKLGVKSCDIREREIGLRELRGYKTGKFDIHIEEYESSNGKEFFIDVVDENDTLIGFIRLRFPYEYGLRNEIIEKTALIRELHIYGSVTAVGDDNENKGFQHKGWGKKLLQKAEDIAKENGFEKIAIISGVGVREYYKKFGYELEGAYMCKKL